jgi:Tol biopolymer transport system component
MTLQPGKKLGPYEIVSPLGAGGMGEVYRAKDTRLGREVAVKVLPQHLSSNTEVRARFEREAKTVSSLNHPHICTLFDVGREGDTDFLVMELIEGETLAARLGKGVLATDQVLALGAQIANALDRAHKAGVVHRDLKPGNIMLTKSGAKLMDFGLARATGLAGAPGSGVSVAALTQSPTVAQPLTAEGTIVGTFQYMSPEQLEGREADERSDIWALGCVLYEMATGKRAFEGKSQASLISSIMTTEPEPISQVSPMTPPALDRLVGACLAKDPADRIQSAHDVKLQLAWAAEGGSQAGAPAYVAKGRARRGRLGWYLALVAALAAGTVAGRGMVGKRYDERVTRTTLNVPHGVRFEISGDDAGPPTLSPDGTMIVVAAVGGGAGKRLWLRKLDDLTARPLPGTDDASYPFWSPDSRSIAFFTPDRLKRYDLAQNSVITLSDSIDSSRGGTWSRDDVILYTPSFWSGLTAIPASGGTARVVTRPDSTTETTHRFPQFMPDGRHFIYLSADHRDPAGDRSAIYYASLDGGERKRLFTSRSNALYANGFVLFVRDSTLMAQTFDPDTGALEGTPRPTREVVHIDHSTWNANFTATDDAIVYGLGGRPGTNRLAWFDRSGRRVRNLTAFGNLLSTSLSPDERRAAVEWQETPLADLWIVDIVTGTRTRMTTDPDDDSSPVWLPGSQRLAFAGRRSDRYRIFIQRLDGSGPPEQFLDDPREDVWPVSASSDGRWLAFGKGVGSGKPTGSLWITELSGTGAPRLLLPASDVFQSARISPDGKWIAYSAEVSGRLEVYVSPLPSSGEGLPARWQISPGGGDRPRWRGDGRELYYVGLDGTIMAVPVEGAGTNFQFQAPKPLFQAFQRIYYQTFDASRDGEHFLVNVLGGEEGDPLAIVTHWTAGLRGK